MLEASKDYLDEKEDAVDLEETAKEALQDRLELKESKD